MTEIPSLDLSRKHPLADSDPRECYDVMMKERNLLLTAKREAEDNLIQTIIKLSSGALLIIPGIFLTTANKIAYEMSRSMLYVGASLFVSALLAAIAEQRLSSIAYDKQAIVLQEYYSQSSREIDHKASATRVQVASTLALALFVAGLVMSALGLALAGVGSPMSQEPRPRPPVNIPDHKSDVPGRSVPPSAPPPPPPNKKG